MRFTTTLLGALSVFALSACEASPPRRTQCNPAFQRGDIVQHRGLPEQRYVVVWMDPSACEAYIRHPSLAGMVSGTDLLEMVGP